MDWQAIRRQYPHRWMVLEATKAHTEGANRVIDALEVVGDFGQDWAEAWKLYKSVHQDNSQREYYILHTDRVELNIGVLDVFRRPMVE
jgi:hypothetical protein